MRADKGQPAELYPPQNHIGHLKEKAAIYKRHAKITESIQRNGQNHQPNHHKVEPSSE